MHKYVMWIGRRLGYFFFGKKTKRRRRMWPDLGVDAVRGLSGAWERLTRDKWGWEGGLIMDKKYGRKSGSGNMHGKYIFLTNWKIYVKVRQYLLLFHRIEYRDC